MGINISPLIHCRTYSKDFNPDFLYCPNDFEAKDISWARKHILDATSYSDELVGIRRVVISNNENCVFGIVCILDEFVDKLSKDSSKSFEKYKYDINNRKIKCFLGYSFKVNDLKENNVPDITLNDFYNLYTKYIAKDDIWFSNESKHIELGYIDNVNTVTYNEVLSEQKIGKYLASISSEESDEKYLKMYLSRISKEAVSFCTNVYNPRMILKGNFKSFTTSINTLERLKNEVIKEQDNSIGGNILINNTVENSNNKEQKKNKIMVGVCVVVVLILIVIGINLIS